MRILYRWHWIAIAALALAAMLVLAALGQETEPPAEDVGAADAFVMLGKSGEGIYHTHGDIPFRFADVPIQTQLLMVGHLLDLSMPRDELPLGGQIAKRVHLMALTAYSLETPHGTPAGAIHAVYEDGARETLQLFEGLDVAEWSYDHPAYGFRLAHDRVPPAFVWSRGDPDVGEHPGYAFYVAIDTQPRPLDRLELHLNEDAVEATPGGNFVLMVNAVTLELAPALEEEPG
jgi:hypothetical protein